MEAITEFVGTVNGIVWGIPMLILILGAGLFLTIGLRFLSIMKIPFGFLLLWKGRIPGDDAGDITPLVSPADCRRIPAGSSEKHNILWIIQTRGTT